MDWVYTIWIKKISRKLFYYQDQYHYQDRWCNKLDPTSRIQQFSPAFHAYFQFRARTRLVLRIFGLIPSLTKKDMARVKAKSKTRFDISLFSLLVRFW